MTESDQVLLEAVAAKLVLGSDPVQDVQGQFLAQNNAWIEQMGLVDDNDLAGFIDGTLDNARRRQVILMLNENDEFRALWLKLVSGSDST